MDKQIKKIHDTEIEKCKFHQRKSVISINNIDIIKIAVSNKVSLVKRILDILLAIKMLKN